MRLVKLEQERAFQIMMSNKGWTVTKRGWPDFICYRGKELILVEVKSHRGRRLKKEQRKVMIALSKYGIACYRWSAAEGIFDKIVEANKV